jgi:hypothetical protein
LRNDAVISHFAGQQLTVENGLDVVFKAYEPAVDATRPPVRVPNEEREENLPDGRVRRFFRWTVWTEPVRYESSEAYASAKRAFLKSFDPSWTQDRQDQQETWLQSIFDHRNQLGQVFFFPSGSSPSGTEVGGLMAIYSEVGLDNFCYYLADCPDIIDELLECWVLNTVTRIEHLPEDHGLDAVIVGDDIAFKSGPLLSPEWFEKHYFHRLARVLEAWHAKRIRVLFHSDGNLTPILGCLVEAGIDGLNPIEVLAGMDVSEIHSRYPDLWLVGGIDVSQLLPYGSPQRVRDVVKQTLDAAEGKIMIGSSTELNNEVPLENFLALRQAVLEYSY